MQKETKKSVAWVSASAFLIVYWLSVWFLIGYLIHINNIF